MLATKIGGGEKPKICACKVHNEVQLSCTKQNDWNSVKLKDPILLQLLIDYRRQVFFALIETYDYFQKGFPLMLVLVWQAQEIILVLRLTNSVLHSQAY